MSTFDEYFGLIIACCLVSREFSEVPLRLSYNYALFNLYPRIQ